MHIGNIIHEHAEKGSVVSDDARSDLSAGYPYSMAESILFLFLPAMVLACRSDYNSLRV
jgi:hypothetical protein